MAVKSMLLISAILIISLQVILAQNELISPCPRLFSYEAQKDRDQWYGTVTLVSESDLSGVWLRLIFDRPSLQLGNWFGEIKTTDNKEYLVKNRNHMLKANMPYALRFYIKYNPSEPAPRLVSFRLNAKVVCPEGDSTTPPAITGGQFTSNILDGAAAPTTEAPPPPQQPPTNSGGWSPPAFGSTDDDDVFVGDFQLINKPQLNPALDNVECGTVVTNPTPKRFKRQSARNPQTSFQVYHLNENGPAQEITPNFNFNQLLNSFINGNYPSNSMYFNQQQNPQTPQHNHQQTHQHNQQQMPQNIQIPQHNHQQTPQDSHQQTSQHKQQQKPQNMQIPQHNHQQTSQHNQQQKPQIMQIPQHNHQQTPQHNHQQPPEHNQQQEPQNMQIPQDNHQQTPQHNQQQMPQIMQTPQDSDQQTSQHNHQQTPQDSHQQTPQGNQQHISQHNHPQIAQQPQQQPLGFSQTQNEHNHGFYNTNGEEIAPIEAQPRPLITYGQSTKEGEFPWHAALYHEKGADLQYICGASLISRNHVITVAHCVTRRRSQTTLNPESLVVYLGKYYLKKWSNPGIQDSQVTKIIPHPEYNSQSYANDIAILKLQYPATFSDYVRPICLWGKDPDLSSILNKGGTVVGWGFDHTGKVTEELTQAKMPVVSKETCIYSFPDFFSRFTTSRTYCAGFRNGTSVCNGDSGGGMVFPQPGSSPNRQAWHLRGLVSISVALQNKFRCDSSHYIVFTDVAKYLDWIKTAMTQ